MIDHLNIIMIVKRATIKTSLQTIVQLFSQATQQQSQENQRHAQELQQQKIKKHGLHLGKILTHVESEQFRTNFELKKYIHTHAWSCLHMWMLDHRSRFLNCSWGEATSCFFFRLKLKIQMEQFNYSQIENYSDRKERNIYFQLKRIHNSIYFALDDYFVYNFREKPISQIVCQDMGFYLQQDTLSENQVANIKKIEEYISVKMQEVLKTPLSTIKSGKFNWTI